MSTDPPFARPDRSYAAPGPMEDVVFASCAPEAETMVKASRVGVSLNRTHSLEAHQGLD